GRLAGHHKVINPGFVESFVDIESVQNQLILGLRDNGQQMTIRDQVNELMQSGDQSRIGIHALQVAKIRHRNKRTLVAEHMDRQVVYGQVRTLEENAQVV